MEYEQKVRKKVWEIFGNSEKVTTFALAIEREKSSMPRMAPSSIG